MSVDVSQFSLEGKAALVTGGSRGIGEATAIAFAKAGADVAVTSRKLPDLERVAGEVEIGAEYEDVHEYIETKVVEKVGIEVGGMIHTGRSRNDQVVVDMRLRVREELLAINQQLLQLVEALLVRAGENVETLMMLYTHGQHAQVGTFAHYLTSYSDALLRDSQRLSECYSRVNLNPLGAGPVGGISGVRDSKTGTRASRVLHFMRKSSRIDRSTRTSASRAIRPKSSANRP